MRLRVKVRVRVRVRLRVRVRVRVRVTVRGTHRHDRVLLRVVERAVGEDAVARSGFGPLFGAL